MTNQANPNSMLTKMTDAESIAFHRLDNIMWDSGVPMEALCEAVKARLDLLYSIEIRLRLAASAEPHVGPLPRPKAVRPSDTKRPIARPELDRCEVCGKETRVLINARSPERNVMMCEECFATK
jgi:hypothetical protein